MVDTVADQRRPVGLSPIQRFRQGTCPAPRLYVVAHDAHPSSTCRRVPRRAVPNGRLVEVDDTVTWLALDRPEVVADLIDQFVRPVGQPDRTAI
jgi:hypothetical protein